MTPHLLASIRKASTRPMMSEREAREIVLAVLEWALEQARPDKLPPVPTGYTRLAVGGRVDTAMIEALIKELEG